MILTFVIIPFCYLLAFNPISYICIILGVLLYVVSMCILNYFYPKLVYPRKGGYNFYQSKPRRQDRVGFVPYFPGKNMRLGPTSLTELEARARADFIRDYSTS